MAAQSLNEFVFDHFSQLKLENFVKTSDDIFSKIDDMLMTNQYIFMYGRSGSGKTTTANEYAYFKKQQYGNDENLIQLIDCSSTFSINILNFKTRLRINESKSDENALLELIKYKINIFEKKFIFILDNVGKLEDVKEFLLNINPKHKFIITTKNHQLFPNSEKIGIEIKAFDEKNCFEYLEKSEMRHDLTEEEWKKVLVNSQKGKITVLPKNLELLVNNFKEHSEWKINELRRFLLNESNSRYSILKEENPGGYKLLKHLAFLNRNLIDLELMEDLLNEELDKKEFGVALNKLLKTTYLKKYCDMNSREVYYQIHESTQVEVKCVLNENENEKNEILNRITKILDGSLINILEKLDNRNPNVKKLKNLTEHTLSIKGENWVTKLENKNLIHLYESIASANENFLYNYEISKIIFKKIIKIVNGNLKNASTINYPKLEIILTKLGKSYHKKQEFENAMKSYEKALKIYSENYPANHPLLANIFNNMGLIYGEKRESEQAIYFYEEALKIYNESIDTNYHEVATTLNNMGSIYEKKGEFEKAMQFFEKALQSERISYPPNHPAIAITLNNIGLIYKEKRDFVNAMLSFEEALQIDTEFYPANHPDRATIFNSMGLVYGEKREFDNAIQRYNEALQIYEESYAKNHQSIAKILNNMGLIYGEKREFDNAIQRFEEALKIYTEFYPANHPDRATTLNNKGFILDEKLEFENAIKCYKEALQIYREIYPANHPLTAITLNNIGTNYKEIRDFEKALLSFKEALEINRECYPAKHPSIAITLNNMGLIYGEKREFDNAMQSYKEAEEIYKKSYATNHPLLAKTLNNMGFIYGEKREFDNAIQRYKEAEQIYKEFYAANHPDRAITLNNMGLIYGDKHEFDKAIQCYNEALEIYNGESMLANHPMVANTLYNMGTIYGEKRELDNAIQRYKEAEQIYKTIPEYHPSLANTLNNIGFIYKEKREFENAMKYYKEALQIYKVSYPVNHLKVATILYNMGSAYRANNDFEQSLICFRESLEIYKNNNYSSDADDSLDQILITEKLKNNLLINESNRSENSDLAKYIEGLIGKKINERYKLKRLLGSGSFGQVFLVTDDHKNNEEKAMKMISLRTENQIHSFVQEYRLIKDLNCQFIITYLEHFRLTENTSLTGYIITEYCHNGDLAKRIKDTKKEGKQFEETQIFNWSFQATIALKYLHFEKKIAHRDIKPNNIFLTANDQIKLGDLGCSRFIISSYTDFTIGVGTPPYISLEAKNGEYGFNSDIWSLGCVVFELITLELAFPKGFINETSTPKPDFGHSILFKAILQKMLTTDYKDRIDSEQLYQELVELEKFISKKSYADTKKTEKRSILQNVDD